MLGTIQAVHRKTWWGYMVDFWTPCGWTFAQVASHVKEPWKSTFVKHWESFCLLCTIFTDLRGTNSKDFPPPRPITSPWKPINNSRNTYLKRWRAPNSIVRVRLVSLFNCFFFWFYCLYSLFHSFYVVFCCCFISNQCMYLWSTGFWVKCFESIIAKDMLFSRGSAKAMSWDCFLIERLLHSVYIKFTDAPTKHQSRKEL